LPISMRSFALCRQLYYRDRNIVVSFCSVVALAMELGLGSEDPRMNRTVPTPSCGPMRFAPPGFRMIRGGIPSHELRETFTGGVHDGFRRCDSL
jgi:hypothetical protein